MTKIKELLKLDLQEDIKSVIDLEDIKENEIQTEIESYIVTDGLGHHLSNFINQYTSNIKESGVWLSGFYGSGKSYFGKMLGYLMHNPTINGTPARDRFLPRLEGVKNQSFIESDILSLDAHKSKVIFLDIAKQNTDNGLAFTLFANFLKSLGFRDDKFGYMEYDLFIEGKHKLFSDSSEKEIGSDWRNNRNIAKAMRRFYLSQDFSEKEYDDTQNTYSEAIQRFSASKLREELSKYLEKHTQETLVFIFDEASEAISQKKFTLLDLEGLSEALTSIGKKVWTIAIAQEKLDDVINNANVSKKELTKVTDRFKTKIHLESTEVDVIIRNRLLLKKENAFNELVAYYKNNEGLINDATNLKSSFPTKTENAVQFATYYPFHKYQFELLQKFLFSSNALVSNQIAARGMIITTFDVLRKELKDHNIFDFTTAHDLCTEAQTSPPASLVNKYQTAKIISEHNGLQVDGEKLLKTIHFINEAELIVPTLENITKTYIEDVKSYYVVKPLIEKALEIFVEAKILLLANNNYKITSNLEGKLLEEMKDFDVELFIKKRELVKYLKKLSLFRQVNVLNDSMAYNFNIITDLDDEIIPSNNKNLKLTIYSLFNINDDRQDFVEGIKLDTQYSKDLITLIPDNKNFQAIDKLLEEVKRYANMEEKYANDDDGEKRKIIREFSTIKEEKEKDLISLIESAYTNGTLIYLFEENLLNADNFKGTINDTQKKLIKNIYTKRLSKQLSESIGPNVLTEKDSKKLHRFFSGDEFKFFDANGNFIGDHLKVVDEIKSKIKNQYLDGKSLEDELSLAPWGYAYGTVSTVLAVLLRAGRLVVKFNDTEYFSHNNLELHPVFNTSIKFRNARFKSISKTLSAAQKSMLVQTLFDLNYTKHTEQKVDYTSSDFDLADAISNLADKLITSLNTLNNTVPDFDKIFKKVLQQKNVLLNYATKTTEANYIQKAEDFLATKNEFIEAIEEIVNAEKFIKKNLNDFNGYRRFINQVKDELNKAGIKNNTVDLQSEMFRKSIEEGIMENFQEIKNTAQAVKDEYFNLMNTNAQNMGLFYGKLNDAVMSAQTDLENNYPQDINRLNAQKLRELKHYCGSRMLKGVRLEYHIECQDSKYSLSDILNYIALAPSKETELEMMKGSFLKEEPKPEDPKKPKLPKKIHLTLSKRVMTTKEYRALLASQLQAMAGMSNEDEIELTINNELL